MHTKIAKVHKLRGDMAACLNELESTLKEVEVMHAQSNGDLLSIDYLSSILLRLGDAHLAAEQGTRRFLTWNVCSNWKLTSPTKRQDADSRRSVVNACSLLGRAYLSAGNVQAAIAALEKGRTFAQKMIDEEMRVAQMQEDLAEINQLLAECRDKMKLKE